MKKLLITALACVHMVLMGCTPTVTVNSMANFTIRVEDINNTTAKLVTITGTNSDSATFIKEYSIVYNKATIEILVKKTLQDSGMADFYHIQFIMNNAVEKIILGGKVIWHKQR